MAKNNQPQSQTDAVVSSSVSDEQTPWISVLDRRLDIARLPSDNAMFPLLRSWVQDNPIHQAQPPIRLTRREGLSLPCPREETIRTRSRLICKRHQVPTEILINSLKSISPKVLLSSHLVRLRIVRKWWQRRYELRRQRYRARLIALGVSVK